MNIHQTSRILGLLVTLAGCPSPAPPLPSDEPPPTLPLPDPALCTELNALLQPQDSPWTGSIATCDPGEPVPDYNRAAIERINFARGLVGLRSIEVLDAAPAIACATLLEANQALSHEPPSDWDCYTEEAAETASRSLLATLASLDAIQGFLIDPGNAQTLGHRRWLLSPWLTGAALGSASTYSCLDLRYAIEDSERWVAWPPPGDTPLELLTLASFDTDSQGWTLQSDTIDFTGATIELSWNGALQTLTPRALDTGFGSTHAIAFTPEGQVPAGVQWTITVRGLDVPIRYTGRKVDCGQASP